MLCLALRLQVEYFAIRKFVQKKLECFCSLTIYEESTAIFKIRSQRYNFVLITTVTGAYMLLYNNNIYYHKIATI